MLIDLKQIINDYDLSIIEVDKDSDNSNSNKATENSNESSKQSTLDSDKPSKAVLKKILRAKIET